MVGLVNSTSANALSQGAFVGAALRGRPLLRFPQSEHIVFNAQGRPRRAAPTKNTQ